MGKRVGVGFGVVLFDNRKLLLGQRHSDPKKASSLLHGEGTWTLPGGKLHFGEAFEDAACREVQEETGLLVAPEEVQLVSITNDIVADAHFVTLGFVAKQFSGELQVREPDEIVRWSWFSLTSLPSPLFFPTEKLLRNLKNGVIYTNAGS